MKHLAGGGKVGGVSANLLRGCGRLKLLPGTSEAMIQVTMIHLMIRRLAKDA